MSARCVAAFVACTLAVGLGAANPALAQRVNGPFAGAFGVQRNNHQTEGLDLSASLFGAYDQDVFTRSLASAFLDPRLKENGASHGVAGWLSYGREGDRVRFALAGGGTARQYASSRALEVVAYQAGTSVTATVAPRVELEASGGARSSPFFPFAPVLDTGGGVAGPPGPGFAFAAAAERNFGLSASVGLTSHVTKRTSVFATATGRNWQMPDAPENNVTAWGSRAGVRHRLSRGLGLHLEYGREQNQYAFVDGAPYVNQTIDAGVDYGDTLAFARRAALSFSTSTTAIRYLSETHYRVNGDARLTRAFNRTWSTWVGYNRSTEFRPGFRAPLLSDSANAGLSGLLSWRARWSMGTAYTRGTVGFGTSGFSTYGGTSRFDLALTRKLAVFAQYLYYHYDVPPGSSALNLVPLFSRQVAMMGLTLSLPLAKRVQAPEPQEP